MVRADAARLRLTEGVDPALLPPRADVLRLSLRPHRLAPRIATLTERGPISSRACADKWICLPMRR